VTELERQSLELSQLRDDVADIRLELAAIGLGDLKECVGALERIRERLTALAAAVGGGATGAGFGIQKLMGMLSKGG
jgi:hypothetical protein